MKGWLGNFKILFLLGMLTLVLTGCGRENLSALIPKGYGADTSMDLIILTTVIMLFVFVIVMVVYVIVLFRFRRKKGEDDFIPKQVEGNKMLETVWTVIPILLVIIIAVPTTIATFDLASEAGSKEEGAINVDVIGNQFWWHFDYNDGEIDTSQDLYIPVGQKVFLHMISSDVIHSFWVPSIAGKMDVNPENENTMYLQAHEEGVYWGKCAELCGPSHSLMDFKVIAVDPDDFDQWTEDMKDVDPDAEPEEDVAQEGKELFDENNCMACHAIGEESGDPQGPNLTNFGNRTEFAGVLEPEKENLVDWIMDPESIKPGNKMTGNYPEVSEDDAGKIAEYLMQLKETDVTPESVKE